MKNKNLKLKIFLLFVFVFLTSITSNKIALADGVTNTISAWGVVGGFKISDSVSYRPVGYGVTAKCEAEDEYSNHPTVDEQYSITCTPIYIPGEYLVYPTSYTFAGVPSHSGVIKKTKSFFVFKKGCGRHGCWWSPMPPMIVYLQMNAYAGETTMGDLDAGDWDSLFHQGDDDSFESEDSDDENNGGIDYNSSFDINNNSSSGNNNSSSGNNNFSSGNNDSSYYAPNSDYSNNNSSNGGTISDSIFNPSGYDNSYSDTNSKYETDIDSYSTNNYSNEDNANNAYSDLINDAYNDSNGSYNSGYNEWASSNDENTGNENLDNYFKGEGDYSSTDNISDDIIGLNSNNDLNSQNNNDNLSSIANPIYDDNGNIIGYDNSNGLNNDTSYANGYTNGYTNNSLYNDMIGNKNLIDDENDSSGLSFEAFKKLMGFGTDGISGDINKDLYGENNASDGSLVSILKNNLGLSDSSINDIIKKTMSNQDMADIAKKLLLKNGYSLEELKNGLNYDKNSAYTDPKTSWDMNRISKLLKDNAINLNKDETIENNNGTMKSSLTTGANNTIIYNKK